MDLSGIISISGMGGLFKVVAQTRNGLLVESLVDGKRTPVYSTSKVSALDDISIYGTSEDIPLKDVFRKIRDVYSSAPAPDFKGDNAAMKKAFAEAVPDFDEGRVYASDIKKVFAWYNQLQAKDMLADKPEDEKKSDEELSPEVGSKIPTPVVKPKETAKAAPKASTKGMAKTQTVRKTGG